MVRTFYHMIYQTAGHDKNSTREEVVESIDALVYSLRNERPTNTVIGLYITNSMQGSENPTITSIINFLKNKLT